MTFIVVDSENKLILWDDNDEGLGGIWEKYQRKEDDLTDDCKVIATKSERDVIYFPHKPDTDLDIGQYIYPIRGGQYKIQLDDIDDFKLENIMLNRVEETNSEFKDIIVHVQLSDYEYTHYIRVDSGSVELLMAMGLPFGEVKEILHTA